MRIKPRDKVAGSRADERGDKKDEDKPSFGCGRYAATEPLKHVAGRGKHVKVRDHEGSIRAEST